MLETKKDWVILLAGFLGALKLFLSSTFNIEIPLETIDAFVDMISFGAALFATYKNTYVITDKAKKQKRILDAREKQEEQFKDNY